MRRPRIIYLSELWSPLRLIFYSFLVGLSVYFFVVGLMCAVLLGPSSWMQLLSGLSRRAEYIIGTFAILCIPLPFLWRFRGMVGTLARSIIAAVGFAVGATLPAIVFSIGNHDPAQWRRIVFAVGVMILLSCAISIAFLWIVRSLSGPVMIQDGTRCPQCAYSLIGSESMCCPECGRTFTYEELRTTAQRLRRILHPHRKEL